MCESGVTLKRVVVNGVLILLLSLGFSGVAVVGGSHAGLVVVTTYAVGTLSFVLGLGTGLEVLFEDDG